MTEQQDEIIGSNNCQVLSLSQMKTQVVQSFSLPHLALSCCTFVPVQI